MKSATGFLGCVTILRDTVTTSWSADDICFLILNISCWSDILVLYVFSSTLPVLACYRMGGQFDHGEINFLVQRMVLS